MLIESLLSFIFDISNVQYMQGVSENLYRI